MEIIFGIIIVTIAGFVQGLTSFGFAMLSVPFLVNIFPLSVTVPIVVILSLSTNIIVIINCIKKVNIKKIWLLILSGVIFIPLGVHSLTILNPDYLKIFFGIIVITFTVLLILNKSFPIKNEKLGYTIAGSMSGFLNGSLSLSGPPVILFLSNQGIDKESFRANLSFYFIVLNSITTATYWANGLLTEVIFGKLLYFIPAALLGVFIGIKLCKKLDEVLFRKVVLILLIISGLLTMINAIRNLIHF